MIPDRRMALYAAGMSASLPVVGAWGLLLGPLLFGLHRLFAIISAYAELLLERREIWAMAARAPDSMERRKTGRRDEDREPLARIKALEESHERQRKETAKQGKMLGKAIEVQTQHMVGCESAAAKNAQDNATIIKTQGELTKAVAPMAAWHDARLKRAEFWGRLADKATDKIIERTITALLVMLATAIGGATIAPYLARLMGN